MDTYFFCTNCGHVTQVHAAQQYISANIYCSRCGSFMTAEVGQVIKGMVDAIKKLEETVREINARTA